jgi:hypothetical protein
MLDYVEQVQPFVASIRFTVLRDFKPNNNSFFFVFLFNNFPVSSFFNRFFIRSF